MQPLKDSQARSAKNRDITRPAASGRVAGWRRQSTSGSRLQFFPGDHFFVNTAASEVMGAIARDLG